MTMKSSTANPTLSGMKNGTKSNSDSESKVEINCSKSKKLEIISSLKPHQKEIKLSALKVSSDIKILTPTPSVNFSTSFQLTHAVDSIIPASSATITQEKLSISLEELMNMEKD